MVKPTFKSQKDKAEAEIKTEKKQSRDVKDKSSGHGILQHYF